MTSNSAMSGLSAIAGLAIFVATATPSLAFTSKSPPPTQSVTQSNIQRVWWDRWGRWHPNHRHWRRWDWGPPPPAFGFGFYAPPPPPPPVYEYYGPRHYWGDDD